MYNEIKCAIQHIVDLINNYIDRDVTGIICIYLVTWLLGSDDV